MPVPATLIDPLDGFFLVDKPVGPSSAAVTNRLKWLIHQSLNQSLLPGTKKRKIKIGHGGTLDPLASGLLPIGIGKATKQLQGLLAGPKTYRFTITFGASTTTDDTEGAVTATSSHRPTLADITTVLPAFTGAITQVPPAFSALKVGGQRAYALARAGQAVALAPRAVTIHTLTLAEATADTATLVAQVSKGTYIRVLARDLAVALGTVGHVTALHRTAHGPFTLATAVPLETLDRALESGHITDHLRSLAAVLPLLDAGPVVVHSTPA